LDDIFVHIRSMLQSHFKLFESCRPSILNSETRSDTAKRTPNFGVHFAVC